LPGALAPRWARPAHSTRQPLTPLQKFAAQQEKIVQAVLLASAFLLAVALELMLAQRVHHLALLPGPLEFLAALKLSFFGARQLFFQFFPAAEQDIAAQQIELQFSGADAGFQRSRVAGADSRDRVVGFFDGVPQTRYLLVGFLQKNLRPALQALPDMQQHRKRKAESHRVLARQRQ
jgi:hypothetical protein